jgi:RNA polymerase sigma factor (sigma-70 family)
LNDSDASIWNRLRKGDKDAFDQIFCKYVNILYNYGKRFTGRDELVEDCIQDLFTDLWVKRNNLGRTKQIKPYLLISIKRRIIRQIGKEKKNLSLDHITEFRLEYAIEEEMMSEYNDSTNIDRLNTTLKKLTPKQKEVIYLKFFEQLTYVEIAQIMKVEVKAIYKLMARAINSLKSGFITLLLFI